MSHSYADEYNNLHAQLEDSSLPIFDQMRSSVLADLDEGGKELLLSFPSFSAFYDWLDTLNHYSQEDSSECLEHGKSLLEVVYLALLAEFLGEDQPVLTESDTGRRFYSIDMDFRDLRLIEFAQFDAQLAGNAGESELVQSIQKILRQPEVEHNVMKAPSVFFTMDVEEDTPENHARIKNAVRAQVLKARAQAKASDVARGR